MAKYQTVSALFEDLRRARMGILREMEDAVQDVLDEFKTTLVTFHMQRRGEDSLGIRTGALVRNLATRVSRPRKDTIEGRVWFKSKKRDMIARVHASDKDVVIRPRRKPYLVFKLERKYARGNWPPEWGKEKIIKTKKVVIPKGRFPFRETWGRMLPRANRILDGRLEKAVRDFG